MLKLKKQVQNALRDGNCAAVLELAGQHTGHVIAALNNTLYSTDDLLRWRAVECLGLLAGHISRHDYERARDIIRRMFWALNDESGGSGWASPEAVGEIIRNRPDLFSEFVSILVSFRDDPSLIRGIIWGLGRIGEVQPELVQEYIPLLHDLLDDPDPQLRGLSLWVLKKINAHIPAGQAEILSRDTGRCTIYENSRLNNFSIAALANS